MPIRITTTEGTSVLPFPSKVRPSVSLSSSLLSPTTFLQTNRSSLKMFSASTPPTDDPLAHVFAPPPDESQHDKETRIKAEQEAKKRSDAIDEEINKERNARKNSKPVKILLLGETPTILPPASHFRTRIADEP